MPFISDGFAAPANANAPQTQALSEGMGGIASAFGNLGAYQMRQLALAQAARAAMGAKQSGQLATGAIDPALLSAALANGLAPADIGAAIRLGHSLSGGVDDPTANAAAAGIGNFAGSPLSQQRAEANTLLTQKTAAEIAAAAAVRSAGLTEVAGVDGNGQPVYSNRAAIAGGSAPPGFSPAITQDQTKAIAERPLLGNVFASPSGAPAPQAPAATASGPSSLGALFAAPPASMPPGGTFPAGAAPTGPAALSAAPRSAQMTNDQRIFTGLQEPPKFGVIGKDPLTQAETYGYPPAPPGSPNAPPASAAPPQGASALTSPALSALHGEPYLQAIEKTGPVGAFVAGQARAILANNIPYPTQNAATKPVDVAIMNAVQQANPNFDATQYQVRQEMAKGAGAGSTPGSFGAAKLAFNAALGHLGDLSDAAQALPGQSDSTLPVNEGVNAVTNHLASGPNAVALAKFNAVAQPFIEEATKYLSGGVGTEAELQALKTIVNPNAAVSARNAALQELSQVLQTKGVQMARQYSGAMGPNTPPIEMLSPEAQAVIARVAARAAPPAAAPRAPGGAQASPAAALSPQAATAALSSAMGSPPAPADALQQAMKLSAPIAPAQAPPAQSPLPAQAQAAMDAWDKRADLTPAQILAGKTRILQRLHTGQ